MQASRKMRGAYYVSTIWRLPNKVFYVLAAVKAAADSRGALTPSNVHRTFSVRLNRFTGTMHAVHIGSLGTAV